MSRTIKPGKTIRAFDDAGRYRRVVLTSVADQDSAVGRIAIDEIPLMRQGGPSPTRPTQFAQGGGVLSAAFLLLRAATCQFGDQGIDNAGTATPLLNAKLGTTTGSDTNDPEILPHDGRNYVHLPGAPSSSLEIPVSGAMAAAVTGKYRARVHIRNRAGGDNEQFILNHWAAHVSEDERYILRKLTDGTVGLFWRPDDAAGANNFYSDVSTALLPYAPGEEFYLEFELDLTVPTITTTTFRHGINENSMAVLGAPVVTPARVSSLRGSTDPLQLGHRENTDRMYYGDCFGAKVWINDVLQLTADPSLASPDATQFECNAGAGPTATLHQGGSPDTALIVTAAMLRMRTDDTLSVPDHALLAFPAQQSFSVSLHYRMNAASSVSYGPVVSKLNNTTGVSGWALLEKPQGNPALTWAYLTDGTHPEVVSAVASHIDSTWMIRTMVVDRDAATLRMYLNGVSESSVALGVVATQALTTTWDLQVGGNAAGGYINNVDFRLLAIHDTALSADDVASLYQEAI